MDSLLGLLIANPLVWGIIVTLILGILTTYLFKIIPDMKKQETLSLEFEKLRKIEYDQIKANTEEHSKVLKEIELAVQKVENYYESIHDHVTRIETKTDSLTRYAARLHSVD